MKSDFDDNTLQLLTSFLDNELTADQRAGMERRLSEEPDLRQLLEQWRRDALQISKLPQCELPSSFAQQVLDRLPETMDTVPAPEANGNEASAPPFSITEPRTGSRSSAQSDLAPGVALAAIIALAASLLLILSVSPWVTQREAPRLADAGPVEAGVDPDDDIEVVPQQKPGPRELQSPALASKIEGHNQPRSGLVESIGSSIDQVILLKSDQSAQPSLSTIKSVLSRSGIRVTPLTAEQRQQTPSLASVTGAIAAVYVVASPQQLHDSIETIEQQTSATVEAVSLSLARPAAKSSSATLLPTVRLSPHAPDDLVNVDRDEARTLDRWFGLSGDPAADQPAQRFLLLVIGADQ